MFTDWKLGAVTSRELSPWQGSVPRIGTSRSLGTFAKREVTGVGKVYRLGIGGLAGSTLIGGGLSALGRFVQDLLDRPCLTPQERTQRALIDGGYGLGIGALGTLAGMGLIAAGAPPLIATLGAFAFGAAVAEGVGWARTQYGLP